MSNVIDLIPIDNKTLYEKLKKGMSQYFPMTLEYFEKSVMYHDNKITEFFEVIFPDVAYVPAAIVCFKIQENEYFDNSLHLSILEVSKPVQGFGRGTEIMEKILDIAELNDYHCVTLQIREPSLKSFYTKFGFVESYQNGVTLYVKTL
jgi:GNAT superfamily N-acetyltransferase